MLEPGVGGAVAAHRLHRQFLQGLGEGVDDGPGVELGDGVADLLVELLDGDGEDGHQLVVGAAQGEGRRAQRQGGHDGVRVAVGDLGEAMHPLEIDAAAAGFEVLVGPQRHVHPARHVGRLHPAMGADQAQGRGQGFALGLAVGALHDLDFTPAGWGRRDYRSRTPTG
ncbi:hypothetical protein J7346_07810 [Brevundimonas sp. A19_0]|nr:hypothetical protein [Brevundimonas sp. A19_0]